MHRHKYEENCFIEQLERRALGESCELTDSSESRIKARKLSGERQYKGRQGHYPASRFATTAHVSQLKGWTTTSNASYLDDDAASKD